MRYEWQFGPADVATVDNLSDVVTNVYWSCVGWAPNNSSWKQSGAAEMAPPDPSDFTPFSDLTYDQVESWVFSVINQTEIEAALEAEYQYNLNHNPIKPLPF